MNLKRPQGEIVKIFGVVKIMDFIYREMENHLKLQKCLTVAVFLTMLFQAVCVQACVCLCVGGHVEWGVKLECGRKKEEEISKRSHR